MLAGETPLKCPKCQFDQPWAIEVRGMYDGAILRECPNCQLRWPRFIEGKLHQMAEEIIQEWSAS